MGLLNSILITLFIAGSAVLLRDRTFLTHPALLVPLLVAHIAVGCGVVVPRLAFSASCAQPRGAKWHAFSTA